MLIDLDTLLHGDPSWDEVVAFWKDGEWHEERYQVEAIKKFLRTEEQRKMLFELDLSIEDVLNGRYPVKVESRLRRELFVVWNEKLGVKTYSEDVW